MRTVLAPTGSLGRGLLAGLALSSALSLGCHATSGAPVGAGTELAARDENGVPVTLRVDSVEKDLAKHLPIAAGIGGGSADAAATVRRCEWRPRAKPGARRCSGSTSRSPPGSGMQSKKSPPTSCAPRL